MNSLLIGGETSAPSTSATQYTLIHGSNSDSWNNSEGVRNAVIPHSVTISNLRIVVTGAPGAGASFAFTIMRNGAATALSCTVSGTNTSAQDTAHTVTYAAGDTISIRSVPTGTPVAPTDITWSVCRGRWQHVYIFSLSR